MESVTWDASTTPPSTPHNGLKWETEKIGNCQGRSLNLMALSSESELILHPKTQCERQTVPPPGLNVNSCLSPSDPLGSTILCLLPSSYNSLFQNNFLGKVYHIHNSINIGFLSCSFSERIPLRAELSAPLKLCTFQHPVNY